MLYIEAKKKSFSENKFYLFLSSSERRESVEKVTRLTDQTSCAEIIMKRYADFFIKFNFVFNFTEKQNKEKNGK